MSLKSNALLHSHRHKDYDEARAQILGALGDLAEIELFGRQCIVANYVRPNTTGGGVITTMKPQEEDVWQGKIVLLVRAGPDAFKGDKSYISAVFGSADAPKEGDWLIMRPSDGTMISLMGDGSQKVMGEDRRGDPMPIYDWDGWPCRIVPDDQFIGRIKQPHVLV